MNDLNESYNNSLAMENLSSSINCSNSNNDLMEIALLSFKIMVAVVNLIFNSIIIFIVLYLIKTKTFSNMLFMSCSLSNLIIGLIGVPSTIIVDKLNYWPLGKPLCIFWLTTDFSSGSISAMTYLIIALHRYLLFKQPFKQTESMNRNGYLILLAIWICCYIFWSISFGITENENYKNDDCSFTLGFIYVLVTDLTGNVLPIIGVFVLNFLILIQLIHYSNKRKSFKHNGSKFRNPSIYKHDETNKVKLPKKATLNIRKESKAFLCLCVVSLTFFAFNLLFYVVWPYRAYSEELVSDVVYEVSDWAFYTFTAIDPVLVLIFNGKFKKEFKNFLFKNKKDIRQRNVQTTH